MEQPPCKKIPEKVCKDIEVDKCAIVKVPKEEKYLDKECKIVKVPECKIEKVKVPIKVRERWICGQRCERVM